MKFELNRRTGQFEPKREEPSKVFPSNVFPPSTGYIYFLEYPMLNAVGNVRGKELVWYDARRRSVAETEDSDEFIPFMRYVMKNGRRPKFWTNKNSYRY